MHLKSLPLVILLFAGLGACNGSSSLATDTATDSANPLPPLNRNDGSTFNPPRNRGGSNDSPGGDRDDGGSSGGRGGSGGDSDENRGGGRGGGSGNPPGEPVPEPGTMLLIGTGLAGLAAYRRRQRRADASAS